MGRRLDSYYSVYFDENDPNYPAEIRISKHENCIDLDRAQIKEMGNYFSSKKEAEAARRKVLKALKLEDE